MLNVVNYNTLSIFLSENLWNKWREKTKKNAVYPGKFHLALTNAEAINSTNADVIHLQEADKYIISQLFDTCQDYNFYFDGAEIKEPPVQEGHGLLTMVKKTFEICRVGVFAICDGRNAQYVGIRKSPKSESILCINAHFPIRASREECASRVVDFMDSREERHVLFSGDLNIFEANSRAVAILQKYNLLQMNEPTFRPWPCDPFQKESVLDYVSTDGKFASHSINFVELFGYEFAASDHALIEISVEWD